MYSTSCASVVNSGLGTAIPLRLFFRLSVMVLVSDAVKFNIASMRQFTQSRSPCPIGRAARILGDRWVLLILREAHLGATRFEEFMPNTGINRAALSSRLNALVEHGIVERDPPLGKRARYRLTEAGRDLTPVLFAMREWSEKWMFSDL